MKNTKILYGLMLVIFITICPEVNSKSIALNYVTNSSENTNTFKDQLQSSRKNKDGRYKRKKGFMWGLFKKKRACDCPKH